MLSRQRIWHSQKLQWLIGGARVHERTPQQWRSSEQQRLPNTLFHNQPSTPYGHDIQLEMVVIPPTFSSDHLIATLKNMAQRHLIPRLVHDRCSLKGKEFDDQRQELILKNQKTAVRVHVSAQIKYGLDPQEKTGFPSDEIWRHNGTLDGLSRVPPAPARHPG
jgi:hypothetical protein